MNGTDARIDFVRVHIFSGFCVDCNAKNKRYTHDMTQIKSFLVVESMHL